MIIKFIEIRDSATFLPTLAIEISGTDGYLARRAGFGNHRCIQLIHFTANRSMYDPFDWADRTLQTAHLYLEEHWETIHDGDVVDVEYVLGETEAPKQSEARFDGELG